MQSQGTVTCGRGIEMSSHEPQKQGLSSFTDEKIIMFPTLVPRTFPRAHLHTPITL